MAEERPVIHWREEHERGQTKNEGAFFLVTLMHQQFSMDVVMVCSYPGFILR
jgi:hypothetical protein